MIKTRSALSVLRSANRVPLAQRTTRNARLLVVFAVVALSASCARARATDPSTLFSTSFETPVAGVRDLHAAPAGRDAMIRFVSAGIVKLKDAERYRPDDPARYTDRFSASFPADRGLFLDLFALQALSNVDPTGTAETKVLLVHRRSGTYFFGALR